MLISSRTCFLSSPSWVCWMGWIACAHKMTCMLLNPLHVINNTAQHVFFIYMGKVWSVSACCAPCCSCYCSDSFACLCSSFSSLSCCFNTYNSFFIPFSVFMWLHRHLIAYVRKAAFIISGPTWSCNFVPPLCFQQPSSFIRCIWYASFNYYSWCFSLWCCCHHILMSLSTKTLMSLWVGKFIDTWSTTSRSVLWMVSSTLLSWKPLYLCCWEENENLGYLETWQHSWQEIYQLRTKMNLRTNLQHVCVIDHEGCAISTERSGDRVPRLCKA